MKLSEQVTLDVNTAQPTQRRRLPSLVVVLLLCELCYLLIVALSPLPELRLSASPLALMWTWTLLPSHLLLSALASSTRLWLSPTLLGLTLGGLLATYAYSILSINKLMGPISRGFHSLRPPSENVRQQGRNELKPLQSTHPDAFRHVSHISGQEPNQQRWLYMLLGGALLFSITLLFQPTLFSDDVFTYIFSGRILAIYHADPFNTAPFQFPSDPYLRWVVAGHDAPNLYGPFWYYIASLLVHIGGSNQVGTLLLFKGLAILSHLLNIVLVWGILNRVAPKRRVLGTLLYAWNPLILLELAGSGHSEGVLLFLLFLGTWLYVSHEGHVLKWSAFVVFGLALSMNLIVALFAPLLIWFDVRSERAISRAIVGFCWRASFVLLPALAIWLPFWRGGSTFFALTSAIDMQHFVHSPIGTLVGPTHAFFRLIAYVLRFPPYWDPISSADVALRGSATFIFVLIYGNVFGRVRHASSAFAGIGYNPGTDQDSTMPGFDMLVHAWNIAVFAYLMLVSGWFWPWYLLWILWTVALRRFDAFASTMLVLAGTVLFFYLFMGFLKAPVALYQSVLIFGLPLVYLASIKGRQRQRERNAILHDRRSETA
ncbi:MAG: hypothetical protein NVSMB38_03440 [Ktedonobacteraceae bacterium]